MLKRLQLIAKISLSEWLVFFQFLFFLLMIKVALAWVRMPRLVRLINWCAGNHFLQCLPFFSFRCEKTRLLGLASLATRVMCGTQGCLPRSLLVFWLLKSRREPVSLRIGVNKEGASLQAHAWVETQGIVLNDDPEQVQRFAPLFHS